MHTTMLRVEERDSRIWIYEISYLKYESWGNEQ